MGGMYRISIVAVLAAVLPLGAQITGGPDRNTSKKPYDQKECAIATNPSNHLQLFVLCNNSDPGLFAARSVDGGLTWTYPDPADKMIADGDPGQGPKAWCDPSLAWDTFGNLFITYIDDAGDHVVTILSTDGGLTFTTLASFYGSVDQPTVVAANTTAPGAPVALWIVWNLNGSMVARGAAVTGLGAANVGTFNPRQNIPGTDDCSFGDVAVSPAGAVVQVCGSPTLGQGPSTIRVNIDADGLGPGNFGAAIDATTTQVGGLDYIPAQAQNGMTPEAGLAYDTDTESPHFGRLYLVYTEETVAESDDTDIMLRWSDDDGATWSGAIRVNDDSTNSQFMPRIAVNPLSGNIGVCWYDARDSSTNTAVKVFCSIATRLTAAPVFMPNAAISDAASTSHGHDLEFGDYMGLSYFQGRMHPIWADISNSTGDNPNATTYFDAYTDVVTGNPAASEGDPHITTVSGVRYDFQGAGEYVALRDGGGFEIQFRHTPVQTTFTPGADPYSGIATNVSLNTAIAARVGTHRVTYQPNISGVPDPAGLQLRVDGALTTLTANGIDFGDGGRVLPLSAGNGIEVHFPNGSILVVTSAWWSSQSKWYLNVNVHNTPALEGIMGAVFPGDWLPLMPDGTRLGPKPVTVDERYSDLYEKFGEAWRVKREASLFDYGPDTATVCRPSAWPKESSACVSRSNPVPAIPENVIQSTCAAITSKARRTNCAFDLRATGDRGFARSYAVVQQAEGTLTTTVLTAPSDSSRPGKPVTFTAVVVRTLSKARAAGGSVQFYVDGDPSGSPVPLGRNGVVLWKSPIMRPGVHRVSAAYVPPRTNSAAASRSTEVRHTVR